MKRELKEVWIDINPTFSKTEPAYTATPHEVAICIYPTSPYELDITQGQFFKQSLTGFHSDFSF